MKNLIISLFTASVLFVSGCQENSITDPTENQSVDKVKSESPGTYFHGVIPLESVLDDPYPIGNSFYRISGQIEYDIRMIYGDPILNVGKRYLSVNLEANADLQYVCTVCQPSVNDELYGSISEVSEAYVPLGGNTVSLLEKTFTIQGRDDGMVLKVRFSVSNDRIELNAMWLALPNANAVATEINHY